MSKYVLTVERFRTNVIYCDMLYNLNDENVRNML